MCLKWCTKQDLGSLCERNGSFEKMHEKEGGC